jgi:hypothetical protein
VLKIGVYFLTVFADKSPPRVPILSLMTLRESTLHSARVTYTWYCPCSSYFPLYVYTNNIEWSTQKSYSYIWVYLKHIYSVPALVQFYRPYLMYSDFSFQMYIPNKFLTRVQMKPVRIFFFGGGTKAVKNSPHLRWGRYTLMDPLRRELSGLLLEPFHHRGNNAFVRKEATNAFHLNKISSLSIYSSFSANFHWILEKLFNHYALRTLILNQCLLRYQTYTECFLMFICVAKKFLLCYYNWPTFLSLHEDG